MRKLFPLLALPLSSCAAAAIIAVGLVAGAVAVGAYSYANNVLSRTYDAELSTCWEASRRAVRTLNLPIEKESADFQRAEVQSHMSDARRVSIQLEKVADRRTTVSLRVGDFETAANREAAQRVHEEIFHQLTGKYERERPPGPPAAGASLTEEYSSAYATVWEASLAAVKGLCPQPPKVSKDAQRGTIDAIHGSGAPVEVVVERTDRGNAVVAVHVGTAPTDENVKAAKTLQNRIRGELGLRPKD